MIKRLIKNLRQQSKSTRDVVALGLASVFTAVVATVWLYNQPARLFELKDVSLTEEEPAFSGFFSGFKDQFAAVGQSSGNNEEGNSESSATTVALEQQETDWRNTLPQSSTAARPFSPIEDMFATSSDVTTVDHSEYGFASTTLAQPVSGTATTVGEGEVSRSIRIITTKTATSGTATSTQ